MRPQRLEVEGFTSFRERQSVDLADLDLFVITGPTGSGKSSLLDAIVFALYGRVPRANKSELRDLVTHGVAEARIRLDFTVEDREYVATRRLPRSGGSQAATIERRDPEAGELVPEVEASGVRAVNDRIEEIIGLDYDTFTRAVLLPQGEFAEFLRGDRKERRKILIRLLDLYRYKAVGEVARSRAREIGTRAETLEERLEAEFAEADEAGLRARQKELAAAEEERATVEALVETARGQLRVAADALARGRRLDTIGERLEADRRRIAALAEGWKELEPRDRSTAEAVSSAEDDLEAARRRRRRADEELEETVSKAGDEAAHERIRGALTQRREARKEVGGLRERVETLEERRAELTDRLERAAAAVTERRTRLESAEELEESARTRLGEAESSLRTARERAEAESDRAEAQTSVEEAEAGLEAADAALAAARASLEDAREESRHLRRDHGAAALRQGLDPGDPCPVCGRPVDELEGVGPAEDALATAEATLQAARERVREAEATRARRGERLGTARRNLERIRDRLDDLPSTPEPEVVEERVNEARRQLGEAVEERQEASQALEEGNRGRQRVEVERGQAASAAATAAESLEAARGRLDGAETVLSEHYPDGLPDDPEDELERRRARLREAREAAAAAARAQEQARERRDAARAERDEYRRQAGRIDAGIAEVRGRLEERRADLADGVEVSVPEPPGGGEETDRSGWTAVAAEWAQEVAATVDEARERARQRGADRVAEVRERLRERQVELPADADADALRQTLERSLAEARRQETRAQERMGEMERALERRAQLVEEIEELQSRAGRLRFLGTELREDRFIDFILAESLGHLATSASAELGRISDRRYSLGAQEHSFVVIDHANADERRSVATLSGGETFLASLALALALAQGLTDIAGNTVAARLEAIFVDEGFGNLDPATLETVVDALERLRETDRMVGVITHVPTLAQRIPTTLEVEPGPSTSRVIRT